jgi:hypothetical protein
MIKLAYKAGARKYDIIKSLAKDLSKSEDSIVKELEKNNLIGLTESINESTEEYGKTLAKIAKDKQLKMLSKKDKETLLKIAQMMKSANESVNEGKDPGIKGKWIKVEWNPDKWDDYGKGEYKFTFRKSKNSDSPGKSYKVRGRDYHDAQNALMKKSGKNWSNSMMSMMLLHDLTMYLKESVNEASRGKRKRSVGDAKNTPFFPSKDHYKKMIKLAYKAGARKYDIIKSLARDLSKSEDAVVKELEKNNLIGMTESVNEGVSGKESDEEIMDFYKNLYDISKKNYKDKRINVSPEADTISKFSHSGNDTTYIKNLIKRIKESVNESTQKFIKTYEVYTQAPAKMIAFDGDDEDDEDIIKKGKKMKGPLGIAPYLGLAEDDEDEEESEIERIRNREGRVPGPEGGVGYGGKERD